MSTVVMTNPTLDGEERAVTTQEAFDEVWSAKGWVIVEDKTDEPEPELEPAVAPTTRKPAQAPAVTAAKSEVI